MSEGQSTVHTRDALWRRIRAAGLLFGLVILAYLPSFRCEFIWDDDAYVLNNRVIQAWDGLPRIWFDPLATPQYYPLVHTSFWLEYRLWKLNPTGYHVVNVLLHATSVIALWRVLAAWNIQGAWLAAAIFGVHPVHVESVAWITERKNVLSGLFYIMAMLAVTPLFLNGIDKRSGRKYFSRYLLVTSLFVCALLSKSITCSFPAACLLLIYWKRATITRRELLTVLPWFGLGLIAALNTSWLERSHVGASGSAFAWPFLARCWIAGNAVWFYLGKLLWPYPLVFFYPRWNIETASISDWIAPILAVVLPIVLWLCRNCLGRGPLVAVLYFGGTLLPALGFVNVFPMRYSFVADHFQYLASLGPIVLFATCADLLMSRFVRGNVATWLLTAVLLAPLCVLTWCQQEVYLSVETLWADVLAKNPQCSAAHFFLGKSDFEHQRWKQAESHLRESIRLETDDYDVHSSWRLLGDSLIGQGLLDDAEACFQEALKLRPAFWEAKVGLATVAAHRQQLDHAIQILRDVVEENPRQPSVRSSLGNLLLLTGDRRGATEQFLATLDLQPDLSEGMEKLAAIFARQGALDEAQHIYERILQHRPHDSSIEARLARIRKLRQNAR